MSDHSVEFWFQNDAGRETTLVIEPWGTEVRLAPLEQVKFVLRDQHRAPWYIFSMQDGGRLAMWVETGEFPEITRSADQGRVAPPPPPPRPREDPLWDHELDG